LQTSILQSASRLLKPGGRLVYATCSLLEQENEQIANQFSAQNPDFTPMDVAQVLEALKVPYAQDLCRKPGNGASQLRLWPHAHKVDGFFAAVWQKK
jgi:16S rRNA (cytosine967-C5)-methyltransferase